MSSLCFFYLFQRIEKTRRGGTKKKKKAINKKPCLSVSDDRARKAKLRQREVEGMQGGVGRWGRRESLLHLLLPNRYSLKLEDLFLHLCMSPCTPVANKTLSGKVLPLVWVPSTSFLYAPSQCLPRFCLISVGCGNRLHPRLFPCLLMFIKSC